MRALFFAIVSFFALLAHAQFNEDDVTLEEIEVVAQRTNESYMIEVGTGNFCDSMGARYSICSDVFRNNLGPSYSDIFQGADNQTREEPPKITDFIEEEVLIEAGRAAGMDEAIKQIAEDLTEEGAELEEVLGRHLEAYAAALSRFEAELYRRAPSQFRSYMRAGAEYTVRNPQ